MALSASLYLSSSPRTARVRFLRLSLSRRYPLSLGAGRSVSPFFSLSSSLALPFSLPLPLVLGRRRNSLDVSESLVLFYQPSVVDRPECDWPSCRDDSGTRFRIVRWIRSLDSETTGGFGCTFVAHAALSLSPTWINRGIVVWEDRQTLGAGSRRLRTLRYSISVSGSRPAGPRSTAAVNGVARYVGVSPPPSLTLSLSFALPRSFSPPARLHVFSPFAGARFDRGDQ